MDVQSAFNSGLQGFQKATESANQAASDIAHSTHFHANETQTNESSASESSSTASNSTSNNIPNLNQSIVDLKVAEHQAKASANVIKTADETLGTLLDVSI